MTSRGRSRSTGRRRVRVVVSTVFVLVLATGVAGCGEKDPSIDEVREDAREQLVEDGATEAQAECVTERISDDLLEILSRGDEVDRTTDDFQAYSDAVVACSSAK